MGNQCNCCKTRRAGKVLSQQRVKIVLLVLVCVCGVGGGENRMSMPTDIPAT